MRGRPDKSYRANPPAIAKIAARPAAIAAHALHWLCSYTKRRSNLGSLRPVPKPRFARLRFRNLTRADMNQSIAAAAAKVSDRTSRASFMRVSAKAVKESPKSKISSFPWGGGLKNSFAADALSRQDGYCSYLDWSSDERRNRQSPANLSALYLNEHGPFPWRTTQMFGLPIVLDRVAFRGRKSARRGSCRYSERLG
jgi:hypothetical protein